MSSYIEKRQLDFTRYELQYKVKFPYPYVSLNMQRTAQKKEGSETAASRLFHSDGAPRLALCLFPGIFLFALVQMRRACGGSRFPAVLSGGALQEHGSRDVAAYQYGPDSNLGVAVVYCKPLGLLELLRHHVLGTNDTFLC